ncbi:1391_t:CDS:2 [Dentiscutata erythropus]|uniref:1391_t:CDS:1 n=1 Tax=Dentiscutata erythropus TaxID=1348616 RepID=A0A9N9GDJ0_9GLOM|nr:1391_t:CDS:2 [Dentiscutata erythropus]
MLSIICSRSFVTNSKVRKVVIIGGSGFIGKYVAKVFAQDANTSILTGARHSKIDDLKLSGNQVLPPMKCDITSQDEVLKTCEGANIIVNLVGIMHEKPPIYTFENVQHLGARNVAIAAKQNDAQLIHISAIGADPKSEVPYARTKGLGEVAIREIYPIATIIRPSIVFGPEDDFFNRFSKLVRLLPFVPVFGGGSTKFQPVYVGNLAMAAAKASNQSLKFQGKVFEIGGPKGIKRPILSLPWQIGLIQGYFLEKLPKNLFTITRDQIKLLKKDNVVSNMEGILTLKDLGIEPTPAEKAMLKNFILLFIYF